MATVGFKWNNARVTEGNSGKSLIEFFVELSSVLANPVSVAYATSMGTTSGAQDFTSVSGTVTFNPGETSKKVAVEVLGDTQYEAEEWFRIDLSSPQGVELVQQGSEGYRSPWALGYIANDDISTNPTVGFSQNNFRVNEGNSGNSLMEFVVALSRVSSAPVSVSYATSVGTTSGAQDFISSSSTVTFSPGETSKNISVEVLGDTQYEPEDWFRIDLSSPQGAELVQPGAEGFRSSWALGYIVNDDSAAVPTVGFTHNNSRVLEGNSGRSLMEFVVTLSSASAASISVSYSTSVGTTSGAADFVNSSGTLSFSAGETSKKIVVEVLGDTQYESEEWFRIDLSSPLGAQLVQPGAEGFRSAWALGYITNDDNAQESGGSTPPANNSPAGAIVILGNATQGQVLTASHTLTDADGLPTSGSGALTYQWLADSAVIAGATSPTLTLTQSQVGKAIAVTAKYTDNRGTAESVASAATTKVANTNDAPTGTVTISGSAAQGQTLTASNTLVDADGIPTSGTGAIGYQWLADGVAITSATGSSITLTQAQVGSAISVRAGYTDNFGATESIQSASTAAVAAPVHSNSLHGMVYHWKSHLLLSGVSVRAVDAAASTSSGDLFDLRGAQYNANENSATVQVWANPTVAQVGSFDFTFASASASAITFTNSLSTDWTLLTNSPRASELIVGTFLSNTGTTGVSGAVQLGTVKIELAAGMANDSVNVGNIFVGSASVSGMTMDMAGQSTGVSGQFQFTGLANGSHVLSAGRDAADSSTAITSADALAALRIAVGLNPNPDPDGTGPLSASKISPYQFIAADANDDGRVNSADALAILRMAVKAPTAPPQKWKFVNETLDLWNETTQTSSLTPANAVWNANLTASSGTAANLIGVLKGDVNGSWAAPAGSVDLDSTHPNYFQVLGTQSNIPTDVWGT